MHKSDAQTSLHKNVTHTSSILELRSVILTDSWSDSVEMAVLVRSCSRHRHSNSSAAKLPYD